MKKLTPEEKALEIIGDAAIAVAKKDPEFRQQLLEILLRLAISRADMRGISQMMGVDFSDDRQRPKRKKRRHF